MSLLLVGPAAAVGTSNRAGVAEVKEQRQEMKAERVEARTEAKEARCELIESRINNRLNFAEQNRNKHYQIYEGVRKRIASLIEQWKGRGCDVTGLQTKLETFGKLIEEFAAAFREVSTSLQATREYRCGESAGKFAEAVKNSKTKMEMVRTKAAAVHAYFKSTIQPELSQKIKSCRPSPRPSASPMVKVAK